MANVSTNLMSALLNNESIDEVFRSELENAINEVLSTELTAFLDYEKYDYSGRNSGDSRNGFYDRTYQSRFGTLNLRIPRDREGLFKQHTIPSYQRSSNELETTIIQLYKKGITTREISDLIEKMYGHYYTPQTVSNITKAIQNQVERFHNRPISDKYVAIYCDATYLNVRRDSVAKEALHVILGITVEGTKEVLDYALYPSESASNYQEMLLSLKNRGLEQVLLFITDGLNGIRNACLEVFPSAKHQVCWTHLCRNVMKYVRAKDKATVMNELKCVYNASSASEAEAILYDFMVKYSKIYPKAVTVLEDLTSLFVFYEFPMAIRRSIYTTNLIENLNKNLKRGTKRKEQFPNEDSLERYVCSFYCDYNQTMDCRVHKGFKECRSELEAMFM